MFAGQKFQQWGIEPGRVFVIAGPCVIENESLVMEVAWRMKDITTRLNMPFIFKASYDKANRSSYSSFRGPGLEKGLKVLERVKKELQVPVLSDVHSVEEVKDAQHVLDVLQIPAFLCRQTDLVTAAADSSCVVNVKKGQFLAPWDMKNVVDKVVARNNPHVILTERGNSFGYNNLVADMRSIPIMKQWGYPVVFDATHSVQLPGGGGDRSTGQREFAPLLAYAACAVGCDGLFFETHPHPDQALSDGPNMIPLHEMEKVLTKIQRIRQAMSDGVNDAAHKSLT